MKRRASLAGLAVIVTACSLPVSGSDSADALTGKIVSRGQAVLVPLVALANAFGINTQAAVAGALDAASRAVSDVANQVGNGAAAVARAAVSSKVDGLLIDAGQIVLAALQIVPGTSSIVAIVEDAIKVAPTVISLANAILNPTAAAAPAASGGAAARRLGIVT